MFFSRSTLHSISCFTCGGFIGTYFFDGVIRLTRVEGPSMEPIFQPQDKILGISPIVWCFAVNLYNKVFSFSSTSSINFFNGRIVVCEMSPGTNYCKVAFLNEDKSNSRRRHQQENEENRCGDKVTILGVNSKESKDSRDFGQIPLGSVKSVVLCKYYPKFVWLLGKEMEIK
jgi:hypothetical protein